MFVNLRPSILPPATVIPPLADKRFSGTNSFCLTQTFKTLSPSRTATIFAVKSLDESSSSKQEIIRNTANFHPNIWGDQFLEYHEKEGHAVEEKLVEELREQVRKEFLVALNTPTQHMELIQLIDSIQHLGIAYYFDHEINTALHHIHQEYGNDWIGKDSLHSASLWFRLLRQQGFNVSSGIFESFKNENGDFMEPLDEDVQGLLALYEASYLGVPGEAVLDDALVFSKARLQNIADDPLTIRSNPSLANQIHNALQKPIWKRVPRIEAVRYIPIYEQEASHNQSLLRLAKLGFNLLQELHRKELSELCKWWKCLDVPNNFPYARYRPVECYFWILVAVYVEPQYSRARVFLAKTIAWTSITDDTYDAYGTCEELEIFTKAIEKWSLSCLDELPDYMKRLYRAIYDPNKEMEEILENEGKGYRIKYSVDVLKEYMRTYMTEARWLKEGYIPTTEEYLANGLVSTSYPYCVVTSLVDMDDMITEEAFKWLATIPPLVKASGAICRRRNDITSRKKERERPHVASCVECYMKQHGVSEEQACDLLYKEVEDEWKVMNQEYLRMPEGVPMLAAMPAINLARGTEQVHTKDRDDYTTTGREVIDDITSFFIVPMNV